MANRMQWESDRDESLVAGMYGSSQLYVYRVETPDPKADDKPPPAPDDVSSAPEAAAAQPLGDFFQTVDSIEQAVPTESMGVIGGWSSIVQSSAEYVPPSSPLASTAPQTSPESPAAVPAGSPMSPPAVGDMMPSLEDMDKKMLGADAAPAKSAERPRKQVPSIEESKANAVYNVVRKDRMDTDDADRPAEKPFSVQEPKPNLDSMPDGRWPVGLPFQPTAKNFHGDRGNFGGKPIAGAGVPDAGFSGQQSDGTEFGYAAVVAGQGLETFLNNLTQLLGLAGSVLIDHAQRIRDIEENIERSC